MKYRPSSVKYHKISTDDGYIDAQVYYFNFNYFIDLLLVNISNCFCIKFIRPPPKVPWRAICLATVLFSLGALLLVIGSLLFTGYFDVKYADRTYPVLILGSLMFIPGFYHVRLAYYAWKGYKGYSFDDIPDFD